MATPEGKVKARVKAVLAKIPNLYSYWPVPTGYGPSGLDCYIGYCGRMVVVETKAPGKELTPRQDLVARELHAAGVPVFVIDGTRKTDQLEQLESHLRMIRRNEGAPTHVEAVPSGDAPASGVART